MALRVVHRQRVKKERAVTTILAQRQQQQLYQEQQKFSSGPLATALIATTEAMPTVQR